MIKALEGNLLKVSVKNEKGKASLKSLIAENVIVLGKEGEQFHYYGLQGKENRSLNIGEMFELWGAFSDMFFNSLPATDEEKEHLMKLLYTITNCVNLAAKNAAQRKFQELH